MVERENIIDLSGARQAKNQAKLEFEQFCVAELAASIIAHPASYGKMLSRLAVAEAADEQLPTDSTPVLRPHGLAVPSLSRNHNYLNGQYIKDVVIVEDRDFLF